MKTQYYLHEIAQHLRSLGRSPATPAVRREAEGYLFNKWHGLQVVAARVIAGWGGSESVRVLRDWLMRSYAQPHWCSLRHEAAQCLAQCITPADAEWLLDCYFRLSGYGPRHELVPAIAALPLDVVQSRFQAALRTGTRDEQDAVLQAIRWRPDRVAALGHLTANLHDLDHDLRAKIQWLTAQWHEIGQGQPKG